ncbi:MAG: D-3-phosphoglycerate dehydrogenase [Phycisphaeraceae bacterium]|nr:MAG: D-3-phosphoglycerate dehydrogenase [Phycisphaeraceae bacterium]
MRILIADKFEAAGVEGLEALGCTVTVEPGLGPDTLAGALRSSEADVLVVRSTKVPAAVIEGASALKGIIRAGAGYDNIDCAAADAKGISVCNCPGMNAIAVAELAIGHLINLDRRIGEQTAELCAGNWNKAEFSKARGLKGRKLLVIGTGAIGTAVITRAKALGMEVWAQSRRLGDDTARALGIRPISYTREAIIEALGEVDAVSMHVASTPDTKNLCGPGFFGAMKPGAYFINTSRGDIVDEGELIKAIKEKGIRAGLDVYADQPAEKTCAFAPELAKLPGVSLTHHCGASTDQAQMAVAEEVVRIVDEYQKNGRFENVVNTPAGAHAGA